MSAPATATNCVWQSCIPAQTKSSNATASLTLEFRTNELAVTQELCRAATVEASAAHLAALTCRKQRIQRSSYSSLALASLNNMPTCDPLKAVTDVNASTPWKPFLQSAQLANRPTRACTRDALQAVHYGFLALCQHARNLSITVRIKL